MQMAFEIFKDESQHLLGNLFYHPHTHRELFYLYKKLPVFHFLAIASYSVARHHWKQPSSMIYILDIDKTLLNLLFSGLNSHSSLRLSPYKNCPSLFINFTALCCTLYVPVSLVLRRSELDRALWLWPHQGWGRITSLGLAGSTSPNAAQDISGLLSHRGIAGSCSTWCPPGSLGPSPQSCLPSGWAPAYTAAWGFPPHVQGVVPSLAELHEVPIRPFLQPAEVQLNGSMILWCQLFHPVLCHEETCWGYALAHCPDG